MVFGLSKFRKRHTPRGVIIPNPKKSNIRLASQTASPRESSAKKSPSRKSQILTYPTLSSLEEWPLSARPRNENWTSAVGFYLALQNDIPSRLRVPRRPFVMNSYCLCATLRTPRLTSSLLPPPLLAIRSWLFGRPLYPTPPSPLYSGRPSEAGVRLPS